MSGGVDSSVAAALLVEQGYDVIGLMLRLWSEPGSRRINRCCSPDAMAQAKRVANQLDIPFYVIDAQDVFFDQVVIPFIDGYTQGITPNPCLWCNRQVRWEFLFNHAQAFGARFMATGHYARVRYYSDRFQLMKALDQNKDQSYVLHVLDQEKLSRALFPLGEFSKVEVRDIARRLRLPVAERPDSQDLCFIGNGDYREFLIRNSDQEFSEGEIRNTQGEILGRHRGLAMYTIGQRRGLGLSSSAPLYVIEKNQRNNALTVGSKVELEQQKLWANNVNWVSIEPPKKPIHSQVKIRYKSSEESAIITALQDRSVEVVFDNKIKGITPGQAAVFYDNDICLGGGIIKASQ